MTNLTYLLGGGFKEPQSYEYEPQQVTAEEAAEYLIGRKKVTIMTGAGISAASGIPTFRG